MTEAPEDDPVPVSVRLGEVVPPEDPEDWTKPLTWVAAAGMLLGPTVAFAWFGLAPPDEPRVAAGTGLLAGALAVGAVLTGATQQGRLRAVTGTVAAALFAALVVIVAGAALAGQRQVGVASPTLAHAFGAAVAGLAGAVLISPLAAVVARWPSRLARFATTAPPAAGVALVGLFAVFGG